MNNQNKDEDRVAKTTIKHLGGIKRLKAFLGMSSIKFLDNGISFIFDDNSKKARITLTMDTYKLEFMLKQEGTWKVEKTVNNIYCDRLVDIFEQTTGFYLSF